MTTPEYYGIFMRNRLKRKKNKRRVKMGCRLYSLKYTILNIFWFLISKWYLIISIHWFLWLYFCMSASTLKKILVCRMIVNENYHLINTGSLLSIAQRMLFKLISSTEKCFVFDFCLTRSVTTKWISLYFYFLYLPIIIIIVFVTSKCDRRMTKLRYNFLIKK